MILFKMFLFVYKNSKNCFVYFSLILVLSIVSTLVEVLYPSIISRFIDQFIIVKGSADLSFFIALTIGLSVLSLVSMFFSEILTVKLSILQCSNIYRFIIHKLITKDCIIVEQYDKSYLSKRVYSDVQQLSNFIIGAIFDFSINLFYLLGSVYFIALQGKFWFFFFFAIVSLYSLLYNFFRQKIVLIQNCMVESESKLFSAIFLYLKHIRQIKVHDIRCVFDNNLDNKQSVFYQVCAKHAKLRFYFSRSSNILNYLITSLIFITIGYDLSGIQLSAGEFVALSGYFGLGLSSVGVFYNLAQNYFLAKICFERISELILLPEEVVISNDGALKRNFKITLNSVSFRYPNSDTYLFKDLTFEFLPGNIYLIKGDNGRGKSTLINLILGLYKCSDGEIDFSGTNFSSISPMLFRYRYLSYMEQSPFILPLSVIENIELFKADDSYNADVVSFLSGHLSVSNSYISQKDIELESLLSGGEKQKISFIRAMSTDKPLVILDEPTTSVDVQTRKFMASYINRISFDKIIIIVSHDDAFLNDIGEFKILNLNSLSTDV